MARAFEGPTPALLGLVLRNLGRVLVDTRAGALPKLVLSEAGNLPELARFYLDEQHARDLDTLRHAGRDARICPYEITRAALAFNDLWIGDYNYVFAPRNRGLFFEQPGFAAARTLLLVDEAHNLPTRVADAYSHGFTATEAFFVREELHRARPIATLSLEAQERHERNERVFRDD